MQPLVLLRDVVAMLAIVASERDLVPHGLFLFPRGEAATARVIEQFG
jgi:hypothetical protein